MYKCPHCGQPGISKIRKMFLGPGLTITCKACGKKVGVPHTARLAGIPCYVALFAAVIIELWTVKILLLSSGSLAWIVIHMKWVPLERR